MTVVGADSPALSKGSLLPSPAKENIRLYSGRFCPFAHRARLVLNFKNIPYEIVNIDLKEKPEWYQTISPLGKVPLLEFESGNKRLAESLIIAEYLDDKFPESGSGRLLPDDPLKRAKQKMLIEVIGSKIVGPHQQTILKGEPENKEALLKALDEIEVLRKTTPFFAGEQIGFVDLMVWPWFERLPAVEKYRDISLPVERFPRISDWCERMRVNPAVKLTAQSTEIYTEFYKTRNPNAGL
jgi:pyrimidodiazepine synthase